MLANAPVRHEGWVGAGWVPSWMGAFRLGGCLRARWVLVGPVIHWVGAGGTSHIVSLHYVVLFYTNTVSVLVGPCRSVSVRFGPFRPVSIRFGPFRSVAVRCGPFRSVCSPFGWQPQHGSVSQRLGRRLLCLVTQRRSFLLRLGCRVGIRGCRRLPPGAGSGWMSAPLSVDDCLRQSRPLAVLVGRCGCTGSVGAAKGGAATSVCRWRPRPVRDGRGRRRLGSALAACLSGRL